MPPADGEAVRADLRQDGDHAEQDRDRGRQQHRSPVRRRGGPQQETITSGAVTASATVQAGIGGRLWPSRGWPTRRTPLVRRSAARPSPTRPRGRAGGERVRPPATRTAATKPAAAGPVIMIRGRAPGLEIRNRRRRQGCPPTTPAGGPRCRERPDSSSSAGTSCAARWRTTMPTAARTQRATRKRSRPRVLTPNPCPGSIPGILRG